MAKAMRTCLGAALIATPVCQSYGGPAVVADAGVPSPAAALAGVFVPTFSHKYSPTDPFVTSILGSPSVDGVFVYETWDSIEPNGPTNSNWSDLDAWLDAIVAHGKKATIAIVAGAHTPAWVGSPSDYLTFTVWEAAAEHCSTNLRIPIPWHTAFLDAWQGFIGRFGAHLAQNPPRDAAVISIKLTGLNNHSAETFLPNLRSSTYQTPNGPCTTTDAPVLWHSVGYTEVLVESAWQTIAGYFDQAFPTKPFTMQDVDKGFPPEVDATGKVAPPSNNVSTAIINLGLAMFGTARWVVQGTGLSATGGTIAAVDQYATNPGAVVGYQTFYYVNGDPNCVMNGGGTCTESVLQSAIALGTMSPHNAKYLELYEEDIAGFPATAAAAHLQLTQTTPTKHRRRAVSHW
jgi:hypothetical protein